MGSFFQSIIDSLEIWLDMAVNTFKSIGMFYRYLIAIGEIFPLMLPSLPVFLGGCFYAVISFGVLKLLIGRMNS